MAIKQARKFRHPTRSCWRGRQARGLLSRTTFTSSWRLRSITTPATAIRLTFITTAMRVFGEFADNIEGHDRAKAAGHSDHTGQHYAWMLGGAIGQLKAKHDWELRAWYQYAGQFALDPNLVDSDIYDSRVNQKGIAVKAGYMVADAIS